MRTDLHLRQLTDALKETLTRCAHDPDVEVVHDTRTGTRRIEAALEAALRNAGLHDDKRDDARVAAARAWERLLKRVRRAAAPVRDLDVQRKLLKKLVAEVLAVRGSDSRGELEDQAEKLDEALHEERDARVATLKRNAAKWAAKMGEHISAFAETVAQCRAHRTRKPDAARVALDAFARLATRMQQLDAGNLHDFRKGAKKARYMAEAGAGDTHADAVGKALKRLQDAIGDWHDWLMLADEAHRHLGADAPRLTAEIELRRDDQFAAAMRLTNRMRGKLMGEWLGTHRRGPRASYTNQQGPLAGGPGSRPTKRARVAAPAGRGCFPHGHTRFAP